MNVIQGEVVRITTAGQPFMDVNGTTIDPTTVKFTWWVDDQDPTVLTYGVDNVIRVSAGVYYFDLDTTPIPAQTTVTAQASSTGVGQAQSNPPVKFDVNDVP